MTEDANLQGQVSRMPGVPLLRFSRQCLILEPPSRDSKDTAVLTAEELAHVGRAAKPKGAEEADGAQPPAKKRKFQKEPNPLSIKKKKKAAPPPRPPKPAEASEEGEGKRRRRRRSGKGGGEGGGVAEAVQAGDD